MISSFSVILLNITYVAICKYGMTSSFSVFLFFIWGIVCVSQKDLFRRISYRVSQCMILKQPSLVFIVNVGCIIVLIACIAYNGRFLLESYIVLFCLLLLVLFIYLFCYLICVAFIIFRNVVFNIVDIIILFFVSLFCSYVLWIVSIFIFKGCLVNVYSLERVCIIIVIILFFSFFVII